MGSIPANEGSVLWIHDILVRIRASDRWIRILLFLSLTSKTRTIFAVLRIRDVYPGSQIPDLGSRIPDPKTATKERGEKKFDVKPFYVATKFNKIVNYFSFEVLKKKIWPIFKEL
jgi:hypothetical protein